MKKEHFYSILSGETPGHIFFGFIFFAAIGIALSLSLHANSRDVNSTRTPVKFDFWFLIRDNAKRLLATVLTVYIALRFTPEIFNVTLTNFWAFTIGMGLDKLTEVIKLKTSFLDVKPKPEE